MGIRHAKAYTLHGRSSMKLGQRLSKTWQFSNHHKNSSIPSKPDRTHICTTSTYYRLDEAEFSSLNIWRLDQLCYRSQGGAIQPREGGTTQDPLDGQQHIYN
ncbi:hypothetical protein Tco_1028264 [Tanacetum coccineum]|uniref:Uncharacterized protein n=1 Tax=Tanacetum coccineum TaxID=301880 RepID=A0ABQ5G1J5_9ASTR